MDYFHLEGQRLVLLMAFTSPAVTFVTMALVRFVGQTLSLRVSEPFVLRFKTITLMSAGISLWMTIATTCVGILWDVLSAHPLIWKNWLIVAGLTWLVWLLGAWVGLLCVTKILGEEFFVAKK